MGTIITIFVIIILIGLFSGKKKGSSPPAVRYSPQKPELGSSFGQTLEGKDWRISVSMPNYKTIIEESIIDVTGQSYTLKKGLKKYVGGVPYWPHHYVYSYSEINSATPTQKQFYSIYKSEFLKEEYLDLEGNTNYAFILLFDLLEEYDIHKNSHESEKRIDALVRYYPKTEPYGVPFLIKRMQSHGDYDGILRLRKDKNHLYQSYYQDPDYWKLGTKYKNKLELTEEQVLLLNKLSTSSNNFYSIEYCRIALIKLFLATVANLEEYYIQNGTSLESEFNSVADIIAKKHYRYRSGSSNYNYSVESTTNEFYSYIFKMCENALRECYGHKRRINAEIAYVTNAKLEFEAKIIATATQVLSKSILKVNPPDESTEIELNALNTSRWKDSFADITSNYQEKDPNYYDKIISLGKLNKQNPSIENIFFEASKFISKHDKESSLKLYIHYIYFDLLSKTFDNKQLTKTIQKSLFKDNQQLLEFQNILNELIKSKDLNTALRGVSQIYAIKRKKIKLDEDSIKDVNEQHAGTVELLNEYLKDEDDNENTSIKTYDVNLDEFQLDITQKSTEDRVSIYRVDLDLNPVQIATLEFFAKSSFTVSGTELDAFIKLQGSLKNQLIDSINEVCYDKLDDVLIDEEDNSYIINEVYYQQLLSI